MTADALRRSTGAVLALAVLLAGLGVWEVAVLPADGYLVTDAVLGVAYVSVPLLGALLVRADRGTRCGWILLLGGTAYLLKNACNIYGSAAFEHSAHLPAAAWLGWLSQWGTQGQVAVVSAAVLLFPDDRLPGPRWRRVWPLLWCVQAGLASELLAPRLWHWDVANPAGLPAGWGDALGALALLALLAAPVLFTLCARCLWVKARQLRGAPWADGVRVVAWCAGLVAAAQWSCLALSGGLPVYAAEHVAAVGLAAGAWYCVVRYRMVDLRLLVNRALVHLALSATVAVAYVLLVAGARAVTPGRVPSVPVLALAALVALPLRDLVQRRVNLAVYGSAADPYATLAAVGEQLSAAADPQLALPAATEALARALRASHASVEVDGRLLAAYGTGPVPPAPTVVPLRFGGVEIGRLSLAAFRLSAAERRLLDGVAGQLAVAAEAVSAGAALRESQERLVRLREEERLRIRRDLHDGLGPTLAGIVLGLEQARTRISSDPAVAAVTLGQLNDYAQAAVVDVRRLVHDLRPATLDELGLRAALADEARRLGAVATTDPDLPELPAAVEVAVYRIALEALTNAQRHARASRIEVCLRCTGAQRLELAVSDDGEGLDRTWRPGLGIRSMQARAQRLGGTLTVSPRLPRGTTVVASLPLQRSPA